MIKSHLGTATITISEAEGEALSALHALLPSAIREPDDLESAFFADLVPIFFKARETFGDNKTLDILMQASEIAFYDLGKKGANHE